MAVLIGAARMDENGKAHGGKAGDQTGREVSTRNWYSNNWRIFRARDLNHALRIAQAMRAACDNALIGYDQWQRTSLRMLAKNLTPAYWPGSVRTACETDCSDLVHTCVAYAVGKDPFPTDFNTATEPDALLKSGYFVELVDTKYTDQDAYLMAGDILCTRTKGHTAVVLSNGSKADVDAGDTSGISRGAYGDAVREVQQFLLRWDTACLPKCGADGDFGNETAAAVRAFQAAHQISITGVVDDITMRALQSYGRRVIITGQRVNVRSGPGTTYLTCAPAVKYGDVYSFTETAYVGNTLWYKIPKGWVSGKYAKEDKAQ